MFGNGKGQLCLLTSLAILIWSSLSFADVLSLKQAIDTAREVNPDIRSLQNQFESAQAKTRQSLAPTEPTASITYNDLDKAFNVPNSGSTVYQINQPLAFPGKAWVNHASLGHQAQSIYYQLKAKELDVANTVKGAYFGLALAQKNIELNSETKASYERIMATARRRYETGAITQVDLLNAEIALYSNLNDLADLETAEKTARAQLNNFLGKPSEAPTQVQSMDQIRRTNHPHMSLTEAQDKMVQNRPEIKSAVELTEAADKTYSLAKMSLLPDFQLTAGTTNYNLLAASPIGSVTPQTQTWMVGIQATIPLWGFFNERETIRGASHDKAAAEANLSSLHLQSNIALESALENLNALNKKILNYEDHLLDLSEQALKIALVSYSSGKIDFQTLSDTATARRQIRHDYYGLIINYLTSYSAYGQLIGEELQ